MSSQRKKRALIRLENNDPINFTCGHCHQVHAFDPDRPYECHEVPGESTPPREEGE